MPIRFTAAIEHSGLSGKRKGSTHVSRAVKPKLRNIPKNTTARIATSGDSPLD
jgi:hypothetical protein